MRVTDYMQWYKHFIPWYRLAQKQHKTQRARQLNNFGRLQGPVFNLLYKCGELVIPCCRWVCVHNHCRRLWWYCQGLNLLYKCEVQMMLCWLLIMSCCRWVCLRSHWRNYDDTAEVPGERRTKSRPIRAGGRVRGSRKDRLWSCAFDVHFNYAFWNFWGLHSFDLVFETWHDVKDVCL